MKIREVVVFSLVFMFIFSITGNMSSAQLNKSKMSDFALDETNKNLYCTVELSAKDYVTKDDRYIDAVVLFNEDVLVDIKDLEITRKYSSLNGLAGKFPIGLYIYLESAWFVSAIEEDNVMEFRSPYDQYSLICSEDEVVINDNYFLSVIPTEQDKLSWGIDWIDAERVWGGEEDATNVNIADRAGYNIKVGVIDTGIDYNHPDIDDNYVTGIDYVNDDSDPYDDHGHGTHIAGIIGAEDNDELGVIGVAPYVSLYGIKVIKSDGKAKKSNAIAGINWAVDNDLDIINLSFGFWLGSSTLKEAINRAWDAGIIVVVAGGNYVRDPNTGIVIKTSLFYPAKYEKTISVGNLKAVYANPGDQDPSSVTRHEASCKGEELDLCAPGSNILSILPSDDYAEKTGTSMAAPMVAGTCALILSVNHWFSPYDVRDILISTIGDLGSIGQDNEYGHGQINAWDAVQRAIDLFPSDSDNDGLYDREEMQLGTDRLNSDTDGDGLIDGDEVNKYFTNPNISDADKDSDYDGITNVDEIDVYGTNPFSSDTDSDVMLDLWEIENGLNPLVDDTGEDPDGDGLLNIAEYHHNCDPQDSDTDNDGLSDGEEVLTYNTNPWIADTDGDGMPDGWEVTYNLNPRVRDNEGDADGDGLSNGKEYIFGTNPTNSDTDSDYMNDYDEIWWFLDPTDWDENNNGIKDGLDDFDNDGLTNEEEVETYNTDPFNFDTDGDLLSDGDEVMLGTDPNDPNDTGEYFFFP